MAMFLLAARPSYAPRVLVRTQNVNSLQCFSVALFCSARLQAGTLISGRCPPKGWRYMNQNLVFMPTPRGASIQYHPGAIFRTQGVSF